MKPPSAPSASAPPPSASASSTSAPSSSPPPLPGTPPGDRPWIETRAIAWLIGFDTLWTIPELVANLGAWLLIPVCFAGTFAPIFLIQRRAGDSRAGATLRAAPCAVAAALPFPVCGTALGALLLAYVRRPRR